MTDEILRAKLEKLLRLAERGIGGERQNARALLNSALKQHGLAEEDIRGERIERRAFSFRGAMEKKLLLQIIATVLGYKQPVWSNPAAKGYLMVETTAAIAVEIEVLLDAHRKHLRKELEVFFTAYIHRQDLFPAGEPSRLESELSPEELMRARKAALMCSGIERVTIRRQLRGSAGEIAGD